METTISGVGASVGEVVNVEIADAILFIIIRMLCGQQGSCFFFGRVGFVMKVEFGFCVFSLVWCASGSLLTRWVFVSRSQVGCFLFSVVLYVQRCFRLFGFF